MESLLATIIASLCLTPGATDYNWQCVDKINNCAVELGTLITEKSIEKCVDEYIEENK